ncbi:hypothetical protein ACYSNR_06300 [Enterococcus sp. LJL128]|uniref:hypothetical protein n=1 Tax=Enterococcus sp. LJL51 TaxID=3416656 RepID=UPI003CF04D55
MEKKFDTIKDKVNLTNKNQQLYIRLGIALVLCVVGLIFIVPRVQANIRSSQVESLVKIDLPGKKASFADTKTIDKEIKESRAMTVVFTLPSGRTYDQMISLFKDEETMKTFSRSLTIYPIVYDASKIEKKYNVKKEETTAIFFENGKEKNRFSVNENMDVKTALIPELNQLPLASVDTNDQTQAQPEAQTEEQTNPAASSETAEPVQNQEQLEQEKLQSIQ